MSSGAPLWLTQAQCERGTNWIGGAYRILMTQYSFSNAAMKGGALRIRLLLSCAGKFGPEVACMLSGDTNLWSQLYVCTLSYVCTKPISPIGQLPYQSTCALFY